MKSSHPRMRKPLCGDHAKRFANDGLGQTASAEPGRFGSNLPVRGCGREGRESAHQRPSAPRTRNHRCAVSADLRGSVIAAPRARSVRAPGGARRHDRTIGMALSGRVEARWRSKRSDPEEARPNPRCPAAPPRCEMTAGCVDQLASHARRPVRCSQRCRRRRRAPWLGSSV